MKTYKLSPSGLSLFSDCSRCFWLDYNKDISRPTAIFPSLPSGMDRVLKAYFDSFRKKGKLPPELAKLGNGVTLFDDESLLDVWRNNFKGIRWSDEEGNVLRGAVDEILKKGNLLIVLDFKTRGFPIKKDTHESYQDQLNIYNFLLRKNGLETEEYAYLLFFHPKKMKSGGVAFHSELVKVRISPKNAEKLFKDALKVLKGRMPKSAKDCKYCKWAKSLQSAYRV